MNELEKNVFFDEYTNKTHTLGKIGLSIGLVMLLCAPFLMGFSLNALPNIPAALSGFLQIALVYIPSCIVEFLIYLPILGPGGSYLAFLTGNLVNLKIPCAMNARDVAGVEAGTPEHEIVLTLAIATSALVTTVVIAVGALLLIPLRPILEAPVMQPAYNNVIPALFGALAYTYFNKGKHIVAVPLILMTAIFVIVPSLISSVGTLIIVGGGVAIGLGYLRFRRNLPL